MTKQLSTTLPRYSQILRVISAGTACAALLSCASSKPKSAASVAPDVAKESKSGAQPNLTQETAAARAKVVSGARYKLTLELDGKGETFIGSDEISFTLSEKPTQLALDFRDGTVRSLQVNGHDISDAKQVGGLIDLPQTNLRAGANTVIVRYEQKYARDGRGLHRFEDPEDKRVYLYSQFETFDASQMFPCFDQPDLKATFELTATVPSDWTVISTSLQSAVAAKGNRSTWTFPATAQLSPYVFSLHAGPYKMWKSQAGNIPLRLFARQSLAKFVEPKIWFRTAQEGLGFYGNYFAYPYPFKKYDQLIVPDFNAGAMENVAAVTFTESIIHRGATTREERAKLASIILHEMAHMWFGDLVTMKWWNGLWLNESFATYMSALAMVGATEFKDDWLTFYQRDKAGAYRQDQLVTTHPINGAVPDTNSAFANFDAITYGKGASSMKQLAFYLGADQFRSGVRAYFKKYQYGNTTLADFMDSLAQASNQDLKEWSDLWLEKQGVDSTSVKFACSNGKLTSFSVELTPPEGQTVTRPHRTEVGLYDEVNGAIKLRKSATISYAGASTPVPVFVGLQCPVFVYPNVGDQDYAKVRLDPVSLETASRGLSKFSNDMARALIWPNLFEMVRDGTLPVQTYVNLALTHLPTETNIKIVDTVLETFMGRSALYYFPQATDVQRAARLEAVGRVEAMVWKGLQSAKSGSDWQKAWFDSYTGIAETTGALAHLDDLLSGHLKIAGLPIDQDRRWHIVERLNGFATTSSSRLLAEERDRDKSDRGARSALSAESIRPDEAVKARMFDFASSETNGLALVRRRAVFRSIFPSWQDDYRKKWASSFYDGLLKRAPKSDPEFLSVYVYAVPTVCTDESFTQIDEFLRKNEARLPPIARKPLLIARQENARCVRLRSAPPQAAPKAL